jgi:SM-20-related protein
MACDLVLSDAEIHALGERGWFFRDGVLGRPAAIEIQDHVEALAAAGRLRPAGLGRGADYRVDRAVRGDAILWVEPTAVPPELAGLWMAFIALRDALNRQAYLGLDRMDVQVARYPGDGAAYDRHRDSFQTLSGGCPNRRVTAIYYANSTWSPDAGGLLRLHEPAGPVDVAPIVDRLLVFLSERVEHEVLPARVPRCAITAWFRPRGPLA